VTSISSNAVSRIYVDSHNRLWLTTYGGGVNRYLGDGRFRRYPPAADADGSMRTLDILEVPGGAMWVATDGAGVMVLNPDTGRYASLTHKPDDVASLSGDNVISLLAADGAIWVGTRDRGMNRYHAQTMSFERYSKADGLASDAVYGMLEDQQGRIWVSGGKGISVLDVNTGEFTVYDATHGLQSADLTAVPISKQPMAAFCLVAAMVLMRLIRPESRVTVMYHPYASRSFRPLTSPGNLTSPCLMLTRSSWLTTIMSLVLSSAPWTLPHRKRTGSVTCWRVSTVIGS
jgi:streptogramin lyase